MPIPHQYIFRINNQYTKNQVDIDEINTDDASNKSWSGGYKVFKANIRTHLKLQQNNRCAFCRCRVSVGTSWSNLEHLVSKTDYIQFRFTPNNLVYCCVKCNMAKVKSNTLSNPLADKTQQLYPNNSDGFLIINPYHDDYEHHIDLIDDIIIVVANNSAKGRETIRLYKLFRPELAEERAFELNLNQNNITKNLLARLTDTNIEQGTKDQINNIINQLPEWVL